VTVKTQITLHRRSRKILFIKKLKLLSASYNTQKSTILMNFCNPENRGYGKWPGSWDLGIQDPGIADTK